jgi:hypothetical protein
MATPRISLNVPILRSKATINHLLNLQRLHGRLKYFYFREIEFLNLVGTMPL